MTLTPEQREEAIDLLTRIGQAETLLVQARSRLGDIRYRLNALIWPVKDLDDLEQGHSTPTCRHNTPIGDYCQYCVETPEG